MKVAVLGYSGAGKSTLARELAHRLGCTAYHLDQVQFEPGWQVRDRLEARAMARSYLEEDAWVIDGNYTELLLEQRLEDADQILLLAFPRAVCLWRVWRRYRQNKNAVREDMAPGCVEKLDWEFVKWVLWEGRTRKRRQLFRRISASYPHKTRTLKTRRQVRRYLDITFPSDSVPG